MTAHAALRTQVVLSDLERRHFVAVTYRHRDVRPVTRLTPRVVATVHVTRSGSVERDGCAGASGLRLAVQDRESHRVALGVALD